MNITKLISLLITLCFLHSFVVAPTVQAMLEANLSLSGAQPAFEKLFMPSSAGRITASHDFGTKTVVINIQDFHCHAEVQHNISRILGSFDRKYGLNEVYVEGGYGEVDTSWLAAYPDNRVKNGIAGALVNGGQLTGSEYYSIVNNKPHLLKGLEDEQLHRENVARMGKLLALQKPFDTAILKLDKDISFLQAKYLTARNRKLNAIIEEHRTGKLSSEKYYLLLLKYADAVNARPDDFNAIIPPRRENYPNIVRYLETLEYSRCLRYARISGQLQACVRELRSVLPYSRYQQLLQETDNFSDLEKLYVAISALTRENRIRISGKYPDLQAFLVCTDKGRSINPVLLLQEEKQLVESLRVALSEDKAEVQVSFLVDFYGTFRDYLSRKLTADDYNYFVSRAPRFRELWAKYTCVNHLDEIGEYLPLLDEYYKVNMQRNYAFIDRLFKPDEAAPAGQEQEQGKVLVTVTGGFHSEGLQRILEEKKISYVTITPNVTTGSGQADAVYLDLIKSQAREFNANALAARLGSSSGAKMIPDTADPRAFKIAIGANIFKVRREDNGEYALEGMPGAAAGKEYSDLKESVTDALKMAAQIEKTLNPLRTAELIDALAIITEKWAAERGIIASHGLIFEIAMNKDVQEALTKHRYALPQLELDDIARLPENLQQTYVNGVLRQEKREEWQREGKELLVAVSMVPGLRSLLLAEKPSSGSRNKPLFNNRSLFSVLPLSLIFVAANTSAVEVDITPYLNLLTLGIQLGILTMLARHFLPAKPMKLSLKKSNEAMKQWLRTRAGKLPAGFNSKETGEMAKLMAQVLIFSFALSYYFSMSLDSFILVSTVIVIMVRRVSVKLRDHIADYRNKVRTAVAAYRGMTDPVRRQELRLWLDPLFDKEIAKAIEVTGRTENDPARMKKYIHVNEPFAFLKARWRTHTWHYVYVGVVSVWSIVEIHSYLLPAILLLINIRKSLRWFNEHLAVNKWEATTVQKREVFFIAEHGVSRIKMIRRAIHESVHLLLRKKSQAYLASYFEYVRMAELGHIDEFYDADRKLDHMFSGNESLHRDDIDTVARAILQEARGYTEKERDYGFEPEYSYDYGQMTAAYVLSLLDGNIRQAYKVGRYLGEGFSLRNALKEAGFADTFTFEQGTDNKRSTITKKQKALRFALAEARHRITKDRVVDASLMLLILIITPGIWSAAVVLAYVIEESDYVLFNNDWRLRDLPGMAWDRVKKLMPGGGSMFSVLPLPVIFLAANSGGESTLNTYLQAIAMVVWLAVLVVQADTLVRLGVFGDIKKTGAQVIETVKQGPSVAVAKTYGWIKGRVTAVYQKIAAGVRKPIAKFRDMRDPVKRERKQAQYARYNRILLEEATRIIEITDSRDVTPDELIKDIYFDQPFKALKTHWRAYFHNYFLLASVMLWAIIDYGNYASLGLLLVPLVQSIGLLSIKVTTAANFMNKEIFLFHVDDMDEAKFRKTVTHELTHRLLRKEGQMYLASYFEYLRMRELRRTPGYSNADSNIAAVVRRLSNTYGQDADAAAGEILRMAEKNTSGYGLLARVTTEFVKEPLYTYEYAEILAAYVLDYLSRGDIRKANLVGRYLGEGASLSEALRKAGVNIAAPESPGVRAGKRISRGQLIRVTRNILFVLFSGYLISTAVTSPSIWSALAVLAFINMATRLMLFLNDWRLRDIPAVIKERMAGLANKLRLKSLRGEDEAIAFLPALLRPGRPGKNRADEAAAVVSPVYDIAIGYVKFSVQQNGGNYEIVGQNSSRVELHKTIDPQKYWVEINGNKYFIDWKKDGTYAIKTYWEQQPYFRTIELEGFTLTISQDRDGVIEPDYFFLWSALPLPFMYAMGAGAAPQNTGTTLAFLAADAVMLLYIAKTLYSRYSRGKRLRIRIGNGYGREWRAGDFVANWLYKKTDRESLRKEKEKYERMVIEEIQTQERKAGKKIDIEQKKLHINDLAGELRRFSASLKTDIPIMLIFSAVWLAIALQFPQTALGTMSILGNNIPAYAKPPLVMLFTWGVLQSLLAFFTILRHLFLPFSRRIGARTTYDTKEMFFQFPEGTGALDVSEAVAHEVGHVWFPGTRFRQKDYLGMYFEIIRSMELRGANKFPGTGKLPRRSVPGWIIGLVWVEPGSAYTYGERLARYVVHDVFDGDVEKGYEVGMYLGEGDSLQKAVEKAGGSLEKAAEKAARNSRSRHNAQWGKSQKVWRRISETVSERIYAFKYYHDYLFSAAELRLEIGVRTDILKLRFRKWRYGTSTADKLLKPLQSAVTALIPFYLATSLFHSALAGVITVMVIQLIKPRLFAVDKTRSPAGILTHYLPSPSGSDFVASIQSLDSNTANIKAGPMQFIILPLSRQEMQDGWKNTGVNVGDNKPVWIKVVKGAVVFSAEGVEPSVTAQALRERLNPSGRFAADKDLVSRLDEVLSDAGIPVPQVYDLSIVVDHANAETPAVTSLDEIIISGKEYADGISSGRTPAQIFAGLRERKIAAQRQSKEKLYFNDSSTTLEGLLGNMKLLKGSNSGNLIVQPEIFDGLPDEGKQEAINKAGEYMKDLHITLFVDLRGMEDRKEVLETEKQQYRNAGFSGYVTGTRTAGNTVSIHWFEMPGGEKLVEANAAREESYEDLAVLQGALKSALADEGSFVFDLGRIQKTLGKGRDVEMQVALQGLLNDLFKDDPDALQARIEKQIQGLDPQKLQRILSAA